MRALITGITGQDGSYLAEDLLRDGVEVHGIVRRSSNFNTARIDHIFDKLHLHYGDVTDASAMLRIVSSVKPQEVYHLAAQSHVGVSFELPDNTADAVALGTLRVLEAVRLGHPNAYVYNACTSEMYGDSRAPQNESTKFQPVSPYAAAKLFGFNIARTYRQAYGMFVANGILFNHESPRRGMTFVTRKIARAAARIAAGLEAELVVGNIDARRDWGYAPDYVRAMRLMLAHETPTDLVVATGEMHTVREFCDLAFARVGLDWQRYVREDARYRRPAEVHELCGDAAIARALLRWEPTVRFKRLVEIMVDAEVEACR